MLARRTLLPLALLPLVAGGVAVVTALPASAATVTVTTTDDEVNADADCSLREAIEAANTDAAVDACAAGSGADVIVIPAGTYTTGATLSITDADGLTLAGASAASTIISGNDDHRIIDVVAGDLTIQSLSLVDGEAGPNFADTGGAIRTGTTELTIMSSVLADNHASFGGAVQTGTGNLNVFDSTFLRNVAQWDASNGNGGAINLTDGELNVRRSTFTDNTAVNAGGAILTGSAPAEIERSTFNDNEGKFGGAVYAGDAILIANSTFDGNTTTWDQSGIGATIEGALFTTAVALVNVTVVDSTVGAGIDLPREATLANSIVAGNADGDCEVPLTSLGGNVTSDESCGTGPDEPVGDPELGPLANNGGTTLTRLPTAGSIAIDGGIAAGCQEIDQRGLARPADGDDDGTAVCDSGAVEVAGVPVDPEDPVTPGIPEAPRAQPIRQSPTFTG